MARRRAGGRSGITVTVEGPIFDGLAPGIMRSFTTEMVGKVSEMGQNEIHFRLGMSFKNPTGHYRSRVHTNRVSPDRVIISDGRVVYGPWLEGTSHRNQTTRFKGYKQFRKTRLWLRRKATPEAQHIFNERYVSQLGGS